MEARLNILEVSRQEFRNFYNVEPQVIVSAPGRLDFLNTHQDYKGLPVVAVGINLRTYVAISIRSDSRAIIASANMKELKSKYIDEFSITSTELIPEQKWFGNYFRAAVMSLRKAGYSLGGFNVWVRSNVPIASGLGSSGTLLVSFIGALNEVFNLGLGKKDIAELAYISEHDIMGIPCGRLDQYAAAFGNVIIIQTRPPYNVDVINLKEGVFGVVDTGIRHSTADIHPVRQKEINEGLEKLLAVVPDNLKMFLGKNYWEPKWEMLSEKDLHEYLNMLPEKPKNRILFTLREHKSTVLALRVLRGEEISLDELSETLGIPKKKVELFLNDKLALIGLIMTYQHTLLSKLYDVSLDVIDKLVETLISKGALGAKLSGAGLGGAVIALFRNEHIAKKAIREAISEKQGVNGWVVNVDEGLTIH